MLYQTYEVNAWLTNLGRPLLGFLYLSFPSISSVPTTILIDLIANLKIILFFQRQTLTTPPHLTLQLKI